MSEKVPSTTACNSSKAPLPKTSSNFIEKQISVSFHYTQKINSKRNNNKLAVIIGIQKYDSIQNARYANNDGEYSF